MAVAFLALLIALSGTAVALPGKKKVKKDDLASSSVGTRAIAKNGVGKSEIKAGAVGGSEVARDSVRGDDVDEGSLGQVPRANAANSATRATTANRANSAASAGNAGALDGVDGSGYMRVKPRVRSAADTLGTPDYGSDENIISIPNLAGGEYVVQAKVDVDNDTAAVEQITCELARNGTAIQTTTQALGAAGGTSRLTYPFAATFAASASGNDDLSLRCNQAAPTPDNDAINATIVATLVN